MSKAIILCADDYAQNADISAGILSLIRQQRLNAVSCLVNVPAWRELQQELTSVQDSTSIGLHFNLTLGSALSPAWQARYGARFSGLGALLKRCYSGQMARQVVEAEIQAQLDAFCEARGALPDFIDGHQHVHQLPVIRDAWLNWYARQQPALFFRNTSNGLTDCLSGWTDFPKRQAIALLGGMTFRRRLRQQSVPANQSFAGIYDFTQAEHYRQYFRRFLAITGDKGLIMCHPGYPSSDHEDPLSPYRQHEWQYLQSDAFCQDMAEAGCHLQKKSAVQPDAPIHV